MAEIEIRELKPELADDHFWFFDGVYDNDPWLRFRDNPWFQPQPVFES